MKECKDCNVKMVEFTKDLRSNLQTCDTNDEIVFYNYNTNRMITPWDFVKARVCPKCGKLELYVDPKTAKLDEIVENN